MISSHERAKLKDLQRNINLRLVKWLKKLLRFLVGSVQILSNLNYPISKVINEGLRNSLSTHSSCFFKIQWGGSYSRRFD
ncbi:hypothetical protein YGH035_03620 [Helicobacter pylori]